MPRIAVSPDLLRWARERARKEPADLLVRFPKLLDWEAGTQQPTLRQLEDFARATYAPIGFFFLPAAPAEPLPIPDFRTLGGHALGRPSPNLLDTIYACQERQSWYREHAQLTGQARLGFVGALSTQVAPQQAASQLRQQLGFDMAARRECASWEDALRHFIGLAERLGILVMTSGIVSSNTSRPLDPEEFRGFALADDLAPLVFINGADSKAAQLFTLAHELAHLWLGSSALSNSGADADGGPDVERWCNQVAAELLVPMAELRAEIAGDEALESRLQRLTRLFKVSRLVLLRRLRDGRYLSDTEFRAAYVEALRRIAERASNRTEGGGDFYATTRSRLGRRFATALVESTLEGRTLYRDAFRMLGIQKTQTFNEFGRNLGFAL